VTSSPESLSNVKSGAGSPSANIAPSLRRAVGVVRVSRVGGENPVSPSEQRQRIEAACEREGFKLLDTLNEMDVSGGAALAARPKLSHAVALVEAGNAEVIVVAYFDRLVRSLAVQRELLERVEAAGGAILAVDVGEVRSDTASHWLSSTMLGAVAEYHRRVTAERTSEGKRRAVAEGVAPFPNLPPWLRRGSDGKTIELDPGKARVIREAVRLRVEGATIAHVRDYLRKHRIQRSYHGVQALFKSRMLLGELRFGDLLNEDAFPAVIDAETWQRLQRVSVPRGRRAKSERLLARLGVLRCGTCNSRMVVGTSQGHYGLYRCPPVGDCPQRVTISAEAAERAVVDAVQELLAGVEGRASVESGTGEAAEELARRQDALDKAIRAFGGLEDETAARERLQELRIARDQALERHDELLAASAPAITVSAGDWDVLTLDERRALIQAVIERAVVSPGRGPDRITVEPRGQ
jgi:DNA invertase Pin-like site-specific DNA recombinase